MSQTVAHIVYKFSNSEVELKFFVFWRQEVNQCGTKRPDKAAFVVFDDLLEMVPNEVWLEISKIEAAVIARLKLVHYVQYDLVIVFRGNKLLSKRFAEFVNLTQVTTRKCLLARMKKQAHRS